MLRSQLLLAGIAIIAWPLTALAQGEAKIPQSSPAPLSDDIEVVPSVNPGQQIGIACEALTKSQPDSDVRVVLTISAEPGEAPPGYKKVLATEEQVAKGAVRVRIPSLPDIEDHLVNVNVYVMGNSGARSCDAGHVKIVHDRQPVAPGSVG